MSTIITIRQHRRLLPMYLAFYSFTSIQTKSCDKSIDLYYPALYNAASLYIVRYPQSCHTESTDHSPFLAPDSKRQSSHANKEERNRAHPTQVCMPRLHGSKEGQGTVPATMPYNALTISRYDSSYGAQYFSCGAGVWNTAGARREVKEDGGEKIKEVGWNTRVLLETRKGLFVGFPGAS